MLFYGIIHVFSRWGFETEVDVDDGDDLGMVEEVRVVRVVMR